MAYLFNLGGYLALRQYLVYRTERFFNQQTAKNLYNKDDLFEVAIPVNMPGIHDWTGYERISGQVKFEDKAYNYVQMKMTSHTLFLKCIPDYSTTRLNADNIIYAHGIKNIPVPKKEHVPQTGAMLLSGCTLSSLLVVPGAPLQKTIKYSAVCRDLLIPGNYDVPKQPPKQYC